MRFECSRCHAVVEGAETPTRCATCGAETGFSPLSAAGLPMRLFGVLLAAVLVVVVVGGTVLGVIARH